MSNVAIAFLGNIEATQNEIISAVLAQAMEFIPNLIVLDFYANDKMFKVFSTVPFLYKMNQHKDDDWEKIVRRYRRKLKEADIDKVIIFKPPLRFDEAAIKDMEKHIRHDKKYGMEFAHMRKQYERIAFIKSLCSKEVYHFVLDGREPDFGRIFEFKKYKRICAWKTIDEPYGPIYEWAMANLYVQNIPKSQDIYFIGSAYDDSRKYLYEVEKNVKKHLGYRRRGIVFDWGYQNCKWADKFPRKVATGTFEIFAKEENREARVTQSTYMYNLMMAHYTIIPTTYGGEFNMLAFMQAIICNCIPLFPDEFENNNFFNLQLTFFDLWRIVEKGGVIAPSRTFMHRGFFKGHDDFGVIESFKNSLSYKKITDGDSVQRFYKKLLR